MRRLITALFSTGVYAYKRQFRANSIRKMKMLYGSPFRHKELPLSNLCKYCFCAIQATNTCFLQICKPFCRCKATFSYTSSLVIAISPAFIASYDSD